MIWPNMPYRHRRHDHPRFTPGRPPTSAKGIAGRPWSLMCHLLVIHDVSSYLHGMIVSKVHGVSFLDMFMMSSLLSRTMTLVMFQAMSACCSHHHASLKLTLSICEAGNAAPFPVGVLGMSCSKSHLVFSVVEVVHCRPTRCTAIPACFFACPVLQI